MINVSNAFKEAMKQPVKELDAYLKVSDTEQIKSEDDLIQFKISCDSGMCKTAMRKLEAKFLGEHNLVGKLIHAGFGVKLPNNTFEYLDYGTFLITEITTSKDTGITEIVGYDLMINAMKGYIPLAIEYPIDLYEYTKLLCTSCGLELANTTFTHAEWQITQELWENINGITYRDILVQIAQVTASTCIIGNDDKVYFKYLTEASEQLTYDNMKKLKLEPVYGEINSVVLSRTPQEDNIYEQDSESIEEYGLTEFRIENNEIIDKNRDEAMLPIYNVLHGISYYPFEANTEGHGWHEIADSFDIVNDVGDVFNTSLFNFSITIDGGIKEVLKTVADTKTQTQYQYATTIAKRVKNTEIIVNKQEQYIENLVTDMYEENGIVHENFTNIYQDINNVITSVQNSGGNNLIKNSVMYANSVNNVSQGGYKVTSDSSWTYTFVLNEDGYYESNNNNQGLNNTFAMCKLEFEMPVDNGTLELDCINYAESSFDYGILSAIDTTLLANNTADTSNVYISFKGSSSADIQKVTYTGIAKGSHYIYIKYRKDSSTDSNNDSLKFKVTSLPIVTYNEIIASDWDISGNGTIKIQSSAEALNNGSASGHEIILNDKKIVQRVNVKMDNDEIPENEKTYYTFSVKIKKDILGSCYVKIYNSIEEPYIIQLNSGESSYYGDYEIRALLPKENYYDIELYGSNGSNATFTDLMFSVGNYRTQWEQASGEIMNTQVNINSNGVLVKSSVFLGDYTIMSPLEFAGYSNLNGTITKVFSLNKDVTLVKKLEAEDELKMVPIKIVPITSGELQGWAFVQST